MWLVLLSMVSWRSSTLTTGFAGVMRGEDGGEVVGVVDSGTRVDAAAELDDSGESAAVGLEAALAGGGAGKGGEGMPRNASMSRSMLYGIFGFGWRGRCFKSLVMSFADAKAD